MRLIRLPAASWITPFRLQQNPEAVYFRLNGYYIAIAGDSIRFYDYDSWRWQDMPFVYRGIEYHLHIGNHAANEKPEITALSFATGDLALTAATGDSIDLSSELQPLLVQAFYAAGKERIWRGDRLLMMDFDQDRFESENVLVDFDTQEIKRFGKGASKRCVIDDGMLLYEEEGDRTLSCHGFDISLRWAFKPDFPVPNDQDLFCGPEIHEGLVIFTYGWSRMEPIVDPRRKPNGPVESPNDYGFHDAMLVALHLVDGSIAWQAVIPKSVDNLRLRDGLLYICSANEIHVLDARNGTSRQVVETGLSDDYNRLTFHKSFLEVAGDYLYFCHAADGCMLIYRLDSLEQVTRLDLPHPRTPSEFVCFDENTGKCYFQARQFLLTSTLPHGNGFSLLEVDPEEPGGNVEIYSGPAVIAELKPSAADPHKREIWLGINDVSLDEAMVYAEYYAGNLAYHHGYQEQQGDDYHETENFNGKVQLEYRCGDQVRNVADRQLDALARRFDQPARDNYCRASKEPLRYASLDAKCIG